jgi:bifunctional DNA-binding transcriptional regulator/antitoxin component of YhaV-PrlF toxin-antitoxin module
MSITHEQEPKRLLKARINRRGVITIPVEIRKSQGMNPGTYICFELQQDDDNLSGNSVKMSLCTNSGKMASDSPAL